MHEPLSNWFRNRIVLIGDSAHPVSDNHRVCDII
jgi:CHASE2 domain-containing sensor protein